MYHVLPYLSGLILNPTLTNTSWFTDDSQIKDTSLSNDTGLLLLHDTYQIILIYVFIYHNDFCF